MSELKSLIDRLKAWKNKQSEQRDELRKLLDEVNDLKEASDHAHSLVDEAVDKLSELI